MVVDCEIDALVRWRRGRGLKPEEKTIQVIAVLVAGVVRKEVLVPLFFRKS